MKPSIFGANPNIAFQANVQAQPAAPTVQPVQQPTQITATAPAQMGPQTQQQDTYTSNIPPTMLPKSDLKTGSQGQDVQALQSYLVQMGYLSPDQVAKGSGTYGPQTTAAVAKLQQDLGIQAGKGAGTYGPQTKAALAQKYQGIFDSVKSKQAPDQASAANAAITAASQPSTDPVFGAMVSSLAPIMQSLSQVLQNINNPALTAVSLQQEYNTLAQQNNLPALQSQMLNMQNIMNGTTDDIRNEITKAGGFATDSQVLGMSAARNNVILKQYNTVATQYAAAQQNVQNMMQYATSDQQTQLQREQATASITESMASIYQQMQGMALTMQNNARSQVQYNVTQMGYTGLANSAQGNPQALSYYEQTLGLPQGTMSNPSALQAMDTYKQQTIAIQQQNAQNAAQRTVIQMYNAGMGAGSTPGVSQTFTVDPTTGTETLVPGSSYVAPPNVPPIDQQGRPTTMTQNQVNALQKANPSALTIGGSDAGSNQYGDNVVVKGIGEYIRQPNGSLALSAPTLAPLDPITQKKQAITEQIAAAPPLGNMPRMIRNAYTRQVNAALKQYTDNPVYQSVANSSLYLSRIAAANKDPGSVTDTSLADSIIKIETGGGQVTDAQLSTYMAGQSFADKFAVINNKVVAKGGILSPQQRADLTKMADDTFVNYKQKFDQLYVQAMDNLKSQGIPPQFWGNMPDFSSLISSQ